MVEAVSRGCGHAFFPPVVRRGPEGALQAARTLRGEEDARLLESLLARPRFRPLGTFLEELDTWCRSTARRYPRLLGRRVLTLTQADLFGPLISEAFTWCAAARGEPADLRVLLEGFQRFFSLFLVRFARDVRAGVFRRAGWSGPLVGVWLNPEETHNGRQSVLRLRFRQGGSVAYKPRPAGGEALLLAEGRTGAARSFFDWLNHLPEGGSMRLPTLRVLEGRGADRFAYSWQEWIERPRQWAPIRQAEGLRLEACQLTPREAERFWHRAGSLSAACFALGAADLHAGNVLVGARRGERQPLPYVVDLELFFCPLERLSETGLIADEQERGNHHVAFERKARWCTTGGPLVCFFESRGGGLRLVRRTRPWGREEARSVVVDTEGHVGFGAYLLPYLRGLFEMWTLLLVERPRVVAFLRRAARSRFVRVLVKPTAVYDEALDRRVLSSRRTPPERGRGRVRFSAEEREQLSRFDVPYFFRRASGGALLTLTPPPRAVRERAGGQQFLESHAPPSRLVREGGQITLMKLGVAVRDAVAFVFRDVPERLREEPRMGVRIALQDALRGEVAFDWPEVDKRLIYSWTRRELRMRVEPLEAPR